MPKGNNNRKIASLKQQNSEYNELYRKWQIEHKKDYGFYLPEGQGELAYRTGEGFINNNPEAAERSALEEIHSVIAKTIILYSIMNIIRTTLLADYALGLSKNVFYSYRGYFYGYEPAALFYSYFVTLTVKLLPLTYLIKKVRMPLKLMIPLKTSNKPLMRLSVPMAMLIFGIMAVFTAIGCIITDKPGTDFSKRIWIPESLWVMTLSSILYTIVLPITSELIHRGLFLQILRQFGDGYALIVTSIIAAFTSGEMSSWMFYLTFSFVAGYFTLRTGSIVSPILMRLVISFTSYWMTYIKQTGLPGGNYITISMIIILIYLIIGGAAVIVFIKNHSNKINLPFYKFTLSVNEKLMFAASNPLTIIWLALIVVRTALTAGMAS